MMICRYCGKELIGDGLFCQGCGARRDNPGGDGAVGAAGAGGRPGYEHDAGSAGYALLGFFFPLIGVILYLVWHETLPLRARSVLKGTICGVVTFTAIGILGFVGMTGLSFFLLRGR